MRNERIKQGVKPWVKQVSKLLNRIGNLLNRIDNLLNRIGNSLNRIGNLLIRFGNLSNRVGNLLIMFFYKTADRIYEIIRKGSLVDRQIILH